MTKSRLCLKPMDMSGQPFNGNTGAREQGSKGAASRCCAHAPSRPHPLAPLRLLTLASLFIPFLLIALNGCDWKLKPSFPADRLAPELRRLLHQDYKLSVDTRFE